MADERLDVRLAREAGLTRSHVERLIREGRARVNDRVETKAGLKVKPEDRCSVEVPPPVPLLACAEALPLTILYEDRHLAVIDKPCGMVVHPAAGNATGTLVNALLYHLSDLSGIGGVLRPGIVHRLDKDTSGLLIVAKDDETHLALSDALKARTIHKTYQAVVTGHFASETGFVEAPIARHPVDRKRMDVVRDGRYARTEYRVADSLRGATRLEVDLITGRTHQIRVHFAHIGHPLLGDTLYGEGKKTAPRLMLHAWRIAFVHPITGENMSFESLLPQAFFEEINRRKR